MSRFTLVALTGCVAGLVSLGAPAVSHGGDAIALRVAPALSTAPAFVRVQALIEENDDNRALEIVADSPNFFRSSRIPLDGSRAPRQAVVNFQNLPSGVYEIRGVLEGSMGVKATAKATVTVVE